MEYRHYSVLLKESIEALNIKPDGVYVDGTLGGGGHSLEIAKRLTTGRLIAIDRDSRALVRAGERLKDYADRIKSAKEHMIIMPDEDKKWNNDYSNHLPLYLFDHENEPKKVDCSIF